MLKVIKDKPDIIDNIVNKINYISKIQGDDKATSKTCKKTIKLIQFVGQEEMEKATKQN